MYRDLIPPSLVLEQSRYLDVLDSTRFAATNPPDELLYRQAHAKAEMLISLILGDGFVLTENQLIDSVGAIENLSLLIEEARKKNLILPLRVSVRWEPESIYHSAAALFEQVGDDEGGKPKFRLSAWPDLDSDRDRRIRWAESLRNNHKIPQNLVHDDEQALVSHLSRVLAYTNSALRITGRITRAHQMPHVFRREINQLLRLSHTDLDRMLMTQQIANSPVLQPAWFKKAEDRDAAEHILHRLRQIHRKHGDIEWRSVIHDELENESEEGLVLGLKEVTDTLYNYVLSLSSLSNLATDTPAHQEEPANPYVSAGNALGQWAKETAWIPALGGFDIEIPWGLYSTSRLGWNGLLENSEVARSLEEIPWAACFESFGNPKWLSSLAEYKYSLFNLQVLDRIIYSMDEADQIWQTRRQDAKSKLADVWRSHIELTSDLIASSSWTLELHDSETATCKGLLPEEINVSFPLIGIKLDREFMKKAILPWHEKRYRKSILGTISQVADEARTPILDL